MKNIGFALLGIFVYSTLVLGVIPAQEREALIAIYNSSDGANWTNNDGWLGVPGTECQWWGVVCNQDETHV